VGAAAARAATREAFRRDWNTACRARRRTPAHDRAEGRDSTLAIPSVDGIPMATHVTIIYSFGRAPSSPNPRTRASRPRAIEHQRSWATR
jgi:hypothetical protein